MSNLSNRIARAGALDRVTSRLTEARREVEKSHEELDTIDTNVKATVARAWHHLDEALRQLARL